ncbi:hypothetical protein SK571_14395 [Lentzea sp. BCCO 10_0798]|uniref:Uncharacterized protein n=1 Tax=Lentzea kristufekii TaxID=3095430 RepID=A0ABU4TRN1_9PSEU|nr:hypothetical protein [Lentzea sp. BCCO 10_0798]MDX8050577.1 hypothetical protein [Lentzea sp. BCCO 10_0798]
MAVVLAGAVVVAMPRHRQEPSSQLPAASVQERVQRYSAALREDAAYRPPSDDERRTFVDALATLSAGRPDDVPLAVGPLRELGMSVEQGTDDQTGRNYVIVASEPNAERGWGLYMIDLTRPARVALQVPHPANDLHTGEIGLELFRKVPGSVLAVSGTHRAVANGAGDAAHRVDSMFHALAVEHSERGLPQVQLHGFGDDSLSSADAVISPGAGAAESAHRRIADGLDRSLRICRAWARDCGELEGRRNKQGGVAAGHGVTFVHLEASRTVRDDPATWQKIVNVTADALTDA